MTALPAAVVVASNRAAAGVYDDATGPLIVDFLAELGFAVGAPAVVPDGDPVGEAIARRRRGGARVVLTTGGTGLTPTDRTPEATRPLLDREVPGIAEAIRADGAAGRRADRRALARPRRGRGAAASWSTCPARAAACTTGSPCWARARARGRAGRRERPLSRLARGARPTGDVVCGRWRPATACLARGPRPQRRLAVALGRHHAARQRQARRQLPPGGPPAAPPGPRRATRCRSPSRWTACSPAS